MMGRRMRQKKLESAPEATTKSTEVLEHDNTDTDGKEEDRRVQFSPAPRKGRPPPSKRRKIVDEKKNQAQVESTTKRKAREVCKTNINEYDLDSCVDSNIFKPLAEILEAVQHTNRKVQIQKYLTKLMNIYFKSSIVSDHTALRKHQKLFATCLWRLMIVVFKSEKTAYSDGLFKFLISAVTNIGLESDLQKLNIPEDTELRPLFHHILHFVFLFHGEERAIVRLRIVHVVKDILLNFSDHPTLQPVREKILEVLKIRIRDKISSVRAASIYCLPYFQENITVRQCVTFSLAYDPNSEVRKAAMAVLPDFSSIKMALYFATAYDTSEVVRAEAFLQISRLSLSRIAKKSERHKLIHWGLNQSSSKVREIVEKVILPEWLKQCQNSLVTLFTKLDLGIEFKTARLLIDAMYPDGSTNEFEEIDRSFIPGGQKIIPVLDLTLEKAHLWVLLCEKFKNNSFCADVLLPEAFVIVEYIKEFIDFLHDEQEEASLEKREEDNSKYFCFAFILKLCNSLEFEECVRREMVLLLKRILLDPLIEESIIINTTVDLAARLIETEKLEDFIVTILKVIFDCDTFDDKDRSFNSTDEEKEMEDNLELTGDKEVDVLETQIGRIAMEPAASPKVAELTDSPMPNVALSHTSEKRPYAMSWTSASSNVPHAATSSHVADINSPFGDPASALSPARYQSTPINMNGMAMDDKLSHLRTSQAEIILKRHHLVSALDRASSASDFLECHSIKRQLDACVQKEKELLLQINKLRQISQAKHIETDGNDLEGVLELSVLRGHDTFCSGRLSPPMSESPDSLSEPEKEQSFNISAHSSLKALMIVLRCLTCTRKMSPFLCSLFEYYIIQCLEDEDARVRAYTISLYCMYGMLDTKEGRRSMLVSLQALQYDMYDAQVAGFQSTVDLLLHYPLQFFRPKPVIDILFVNDVSLPSPFDEHNASGSAMEEGIISLLGKFGGDDPTDRELTLRITGFTKLFLRGRIKSVSLLAEFLSMWINPVFGTSPACFLVGHFIPLYCMMSASNSTRVLEAFIVCVKEILVCQETKDDGLASADIAKLAEFVSMNTSQDALSQFEDGFVVHEHQILSILQDIKDNVCEKENIHFARCLRYFSLSKLKTASAVKKIINEIVEGITGAGNLNGGIQVKAHLNRFLQHLEKRFTLDLHATEVESTDEDDLEMWNVKVPPPTSLNVEEANCQNKNEAEKVCPLSEKVEVQIEELENDEGPISTVPE